MNKHFKERSLFKRFVFAISGMGCILLFSCKTTRSHYDALYFRNGADTVLAQQKETLIQQNDVLNIQVFSKSTNQEQAALFNLANASNGTVNGYQVSAAGQIQLPLVGGVKAAGLTKLQLQESLEQKLNPYVKNPSVIIRFLHFNVNVLGEVKNPGMQQFALDRVTLIDALSAAGDLTDYGKREDVMVIREENGKTIYHTIDLRNKRLFESPVYVLQPNDVVYVKPNDAKLKALNVDPEAQRKTSVLFSVISVVVSVTTLVIAILR